MSYYLNQKESTDFNISEFLEMIDKKRSLTYEEFKKVISESVSNPYLTPENLIKKIEILLKKFNTKHTLESDIISFKVNDYFCKISTIETNHKLEEFKKIPPHKYECKIHQFKCIYWKDTEEEYNLLDSEVVYLLFSNLYEYKDWMFKDITLDDLYFSKDNQRFFIKNFRGIVPFKKLCLFNLKYKPSNILYNKDLFILEKDPISYDEALELAPIQRDMEVFK